MSRDLSLAEQEAILKRRARQAVTYLASMLLDSKTGPKIAALAMERLQANHPKFKSQMWNRQPKELIGEVHEELADGINWLLPVLEYALTALEGDEDNG